MKACRDGQPRKVSKVTPRPPGFPEWVCAKRQAAGLSQAELAMALGISKAAVCLWEKGHNQPCSAKRVLDLVRVLGVTADEVLAEVEPRTNLLVDLEYALRWADGREADHAAVVVKMQEFGVQPWYDAISARGAAVAEAAKEAGCPACVTRPKASRRPGVHRR